jgi:hypothetical protein
VNFDIEYSEAAIGTGKMCIGYIWDVNQLQFFRSFAKLDLE